MGARQTTNIARKNTCDGISIITRQVWLVSGGCGLFQHRHPIEAIINYSSGEIRRRLLHCHPLKLYYYYCIQEVHT